jgi:hypothetical protein
MLVTARCFGAAMPKLLVMSLLPIWKEAVVLQLTDQKCDHLMVLLALAY